MHDSTAATPAPESSAWPAPPTAAVADAALRLGVDARLAPVAMRPLLTCAPLAGRATRMPLRRAFRLWNRA